MKIMIYTFPFRGHSIQAIKLANFLNCHGHEVLIDLKKEYINLLLPSIKYQECHYSFSSSYYICTEKDKLLNYAEGVLITCKKYLDIINDIEFNPDIIIFDSLAYWGKLIAEKFSIKSISLMTLQPFTEDTFKEKGYDLLRSYVNGCENEKSFYRMLYIYEANAKKKFNLPLNFRFSDILCSRGNKNMVLFPKSLCKYKEDLDESFLLFTPIIDKIKDKSNENSGVYISTGSILADFKFLCDCIDSLLPLNINIYVNASIYETRIRNRYKYMKNVYVYNFAPQYKILQKSSVFITHGGMNSICESILTETPMLVIPFTNDEFSNAEMVAKTGIGIYLNNDPQIYNLNIVPHVKELMDNKCFALNIKRIKNQISFIEPLDFILRHIEENFYE